MKPLEIETVNVPAGLTDLAKRRTRAIVLASIHYPNFLENVVLSCYTQGLQDGYDVAKNAKGVQQ